MAPLARLFQLLIQDGLLYSHKVDTAKNIGSFRGDGLFGGLGRCALPLYFECDPGIDSALTVLFLPQRRLSTSMTYLRNIYGHMAEISPKTWWRYVRQVNIVHIAITALAFYFGA
jgi:hypothetical protein